MRNIRLAIILSLVLSSFGWCSEITQNSNLLNFQGPAAAIQGTGGATVVYTYTLPANTVSAGHGIRITIGYNHSTGSAAPGYLTTLNGVTIAGVSGLGGGGMWEWSMVCFNTGATTGTSAGDAVNYYGVSAVGSSLAGLDWAANQVLQITFNVANTDWVTPVLWSVELIR